MAAENPPTPPSTTEYTPPEDYEFDPAEELEPTNDLLDMVLTRAGEFVLDVIETVQAHPVLTGSLVAAGMGLVGGLVAASVVPRRRRPSPLTRGAWAASAAADAGMQAGRRWGRWGRAAVAERAQEAARAAAAAPPRGRRLRLAVPPLRRAGPVDVLASEFPIRRPVTDGREAVRRAQALAQLGPIAIALLRNPLVRDLALHLISRQVRRVARL
ncbi:MAG: hypothetical protein IRZ14_15465 [Chloroflexi bacterium]|nr:hypothetical protein [Chloroflexota bacterium]